MINRRTKPRRPSVLEALEPRRVLAPLLSLEGPSDVVFEGERAAFTLRLSEPASQAETVFLTTRPGTATLGVDYVAAARVQVRFAPGETAKQFFISTLAEAVPRREGNETFFVTARPVNRRLSGELTRQVTIADSVPRPVISIANISVDEGSYGTTPAVFTLTLSSPFPRPVTVAYATRDGSATVAGNDYAASSGTVTFQPGDTSQTVTVNVNGDRILEPNESFTLSLSNATNASLSRPAATCTIRNDEIDAPGFQISLRFVDNGFGPVPAVVQQLAAEAAARWGRIIVGDVPGVSLPNGEFIDDFELTVQMGLLGDADGTDPITIANARPLAYRTGSSPLPYQGETGLDPADVSGTLTVALRNWVIDVITHEMGHAIGFTPGATVFNRAIIGDTFIGPNALREFNTVFGRSAASVPLQPGVRAHWNEGVFGDELMTPNAAQVGTRMYISRVTIGALADMGYTVNYAAAENYTPPHVQPPGGTVPPPAPPQTPPVARPPVAKPLLPVRPSLRPPLVQRHSQQPVTPGQQSKLVGTRPTSAAVAKSALSMASKGNLPRTSMTARVFANLSAN